MCNVWILMQYNWNTMHSVAYVIVIFILITLC
jgi:hypothetical protein